MIEYSRIDMYSDNVFCFTPKGDVVSMVKGSSALDFAYAIHSTLGAKPIGVKINGNLSPINEIVSNGDQIEVLVSKGQKPQPNWLSFWITGKARSQIRKSFAPPAFFVLLLFFFLVLRFLLYPPSESI